MTSPSKDLNLTAKSPLLQNEKNIGAAASHIVFPAVSNDDRAVLMTSRSLACKPKARHALAEKIGRFRFRTEADPPQHHYTSPFCEQSQTNILLHYIAETLGMLLLLH